MHVTDEMVETIAKWLHDEVEWPEYNYPERSWPEHEGDTGQRGDGWLKIVPPDVCEQFRDIARRLPIEAALAVEGTEAKPVAFLVDDFHVARSLVKARGKFPEPDHYLYPAKREADARDVAKIMGGTCTPLYTTPPAGIREALINLNAELDAMWNMPADQRVQDGQINSVLVQNITNAQIACVRALRGQS